MGKSFQQGIQPNRIPSRRSHGRTSTVDHHRRCRMVVLQIGQTHRQPQRLQRRPQQRTSSTTWLVKTHCSWAALGRPNCSFFTYQRRVRAWPAHFGILRIQCSGGRHVAVTGAQWNRSEKHRWPSPERAGKRGWTHRSRPPERVVSAIRQPDLTKAR